MKFTTVLLMSLIGSLVQAQDVRKAGDPYTYNPSFMQSQDNSCSAAQASKSYYVSYKKIYSPPDSRGATPIKGIAFFVNYTTKMGIHDVICLTAATKVVFNKQQNQLDIIDIDTANAFNWNKYRQDGNFAENETIKRGLRTYVPIENLPLYQTLKVRIVNAKSAQEVMLFNDPRNFMLYVYEDLFKWRVRKGSPDESAVMRDFNVYARGTDEESLAEVIYHPLSNGTKIEVK